MFSAGGLAAICADKKKGAHPHLHPTEALAATHEYRGIRPRRASSSTRLVRKKSASFQSKRLSKIT